jgi:hypothetical protein
MRTTGLYQLGQMKFDRMPFEGRWQKTIGNPVKTFSCCIWGESGNGKTTFIIQLIQYLVSFDMRAVYFSHEEGISGTMQDAFVRSGMIEKNNKQIILAEDASFDEMLSYCVKRGSPEIVVIDSIDYCNMTVEQYKLLRKKLDKKIIILITWALGKEPKTQAAKDIKYMCDVKLHVKNFMVWPISRYGGNEPFWIWEKRARLLNQKYFLEHDKTQRQLLFTVMEPSKNTNEGGGVDANC